MNIESKKDIIYDKSQHVPVDILKQILEVVINNESRDKIKEFSDGCRINLETLQDITIEDIYNIIIKNCQC